MHQPPGPAIGRCQDCGNPISERAIRCRPCAARAKMGAPPLPSAEDSPDEPPIAELHPDMVAWIRAHGYRFNADRLAHMIGVPADQIRAIQDGTVR